MNPYKSHPLESNEVELRAEERNPWKEPRLAVVPYKGILLGFEWDNSGIYPYGLHISIRIPFVSFDIGLGKQRY